MATATGPGEGLRPFEGVPVEIMSDLSFAMIDAGLIPPDRPYFLRGGRIFEKMAKAIE